MIFLNPAVLFGLLAAAIPVLIHLLNLRKLKHIEFSTLAFLKELQKNKIRKLKLKQWLLLVLRVSLILFLVTAFARPTLKGVAIGGTTSAAKTTAVFILDDTFSMSVITPQGSYFNQAKEIVINLLENLQEGDEVSLVLISSAKNSDLTTTGNRSEFLKEIRDLKISDASGTLDNAVVKAASILGQSKNFNKEIYIISDYQKGRLFENDAVSDLGELLNENVKIYAFRLPDKEILNLSVNALQLNTTLFEKDKPVSFDVTIRNNSAKPVTNGVISLFINGERSAQHSVTLGEYESKNINIESVIKATGFIDVVAEIEDDDILPDNKRYLTFNIPEKIPVGIFASDLKDIGFIETALSAYGSESTISQRKFNLSQFSSLNPEQFSVILICGEGELNGADRLRSFIENGGGLIIMPGENSTAERFNNLLSSIGLPSVEGTSGGLNQDKNSILFETINFEHPIFRDIFITSSTKQIESPEVYYSFQVKPGVAGSSIITLNNGSSFVSEYKSGNGKMLLYNSAPLLSWSNFPLKSIFPPLINRSVYYLSAEASSDTSLLAGNEYNIYLGRGMSSRVLVKKPDNSEEYVTFPENNTGYIEVDDSQTAGIYKFFVADNLVRQVAINTDPGESETEQLDIRDVKGYLEKVNFKGSFYEIPVSENPSALILQARFGSELWKYFLFAALILALIEMAVARSSKKDLISGGSDLN